MEIKHIMSENVVAVDKETSLEEIGQIMKEQDIGMVLIKEKNKIIGVLTDRDIVITILSNSDNSLKNYYTKNVISIDQKKDSKEALELMKKNKIKRLIVTDESRVVGIVSLSDLINTDEEEILNALQTIWEINRNTDTFITKIDEFYL